MAVDVSVSGVADRTEVGGRLEYRSAGEGDDTVHPRCPVSHERIAQSHEKRRDAAVVTRPRSAQRRIHVGVQEELGDGESVRAGGLRLA